MSLVFIGLGSNLGHGLENLQDAWRLLGRETAVTGLAISSPYLSEPVGMESDTWFSNAVGIIETNLPPGELLKTLLDIEIGLGRDRQKGMDRTVDLDILYYDDLVIRSADLEVPHPELHRRLFVLAPMQELAPDHIHPVRQQTTIQMRRAIVDTGGQQIKKINW